MSVRSESLFRESIDIFPSGVNSPVRYYGPYPEFIERAHGPYIEDVDGRRYIDYCLGFGPSILGHSPENVVKKLKEKLADGFIYGAPTENESKLGKVIKGAIPSIEKMRFTNSGTEATMHAIRLARAFMKRDIIVKFDGAYHGSHDYVLQKMGSGGLTFGISSSPGIPEQVSSTVVVGKFNDEESVRKIFSTFKGKIAAVIVEPVLGNVGVIPPAGGFLNFLEEQCRQDGSLLIFDEVITGFRFTFGGYQNSIGIKPDITILGKIIGGGLPVGLFGGRSDIMDMIAPSGPVYEGGTFSGNPLTMIAGYETLSELRKKEYREIGAYTEKIASSASDSARKYGIQVQVNNTGPMFTIFFNRNKVDSYDSAAESNSRLFMEFFKTAKDNGIYLPPSQFESNFVSFAHCKNELEKTIEAFEVSFREIKKYL
ncbi:MAG: glutamate-1-semialdehyde 2,1-aminomutase [Thermoplasmataceae archaeon]|jgi:glutamate-1-semialdehyde 2,1-aminomutase